jgi:CspA family cold shock protein
VYQATQQIFLGKLDEMAEGTIKKLTDKGFGFISTGTDNDLFFHNSSLQGVSFDDLREGQRVTFTEAQGQKGPCAENVQVI